VTAQGPRSFWNLAIQNRRLLINFQVIFLRHFWNFLEQLSKVGHIPNR
jgi:hypothetical protein